MGKLKTSAVINSCYRNVEENKILIKLTFISHSELGTVKVLFELNKYYHVECTTA